MSEHEQKPRPVETPSCEPTGAGSVDLARSRSAWLLWYVPIALIIAGIYWHRNPAWLWTPAFLVAGLGCVTNARRCGRRHCYFTGPLFLLAALVSVLMAPGLYLPTGTGF